MSEIEREKKSRWMSGYQLETTVECICRLTCLQFFIIVLPCLSLLHFIKIFLFVSANDWVFFHDLVFIVKADITDCHRFIVKINLGNCTGIGWKQRVLLMEINTPSYELERSLQMRLKFWDGDNLVSQRHRAAGKKLWITVCKKAA